MRRYHLGPAAALALLVGSVGSPARAQAPGFGGPINQPPIPPILNLNRLGAPPGLNYYNIVQPQVQSQAAIAQLQQQTAQIQYQATAVGPGATLVTGHPVYYGNYLHYYSARGLAGVGGAGTAGVPGAGGFQLGASGFPAGAGGLGGVLGRPGQAQAGTTPGTPGAGGVR
jgi:hypothetical protein